MSIYKYFLILIIAINAEVKAQSTSTICSTLSCPVSEGSGSGVSSLTLPSLPSNYLLTLSKTITGYGNVIIVKLQFSRCIDYSFNPYGPIWYKIEATSDGTAVGEFIEPSRYGEAELCSNNVIVFETCTPTVTDLPRRYQWRTASTIRGDVCFSATIHHQGSSSCETLTKCIPGNEIPTSTPIVILDPISETSPTTSTPSTPRPPSPEIIAKCIGKWPCINPRLNKLCGDNGVTYDSRCHMRRDECVYEIDITVTKGACAVTAMPPTSTTTIPTTTPTPTTPPTPPSYGLCAELSDPSWKRQCTCKGDHKLTQCHRNLKGQMRCWCVSYDFAIGNGKEKLISSCESPDTYDIGCVPL